MGIWETASLWYFDFVFWGFEVIDQRGGLGFLGICGILGIWETANLWYFDFVFWGFGKLQVFGILTLYFGDLRLSIRGLGALVFWGFVVFGGVFWGKLQIFGILTLYFGDLRLSIREGALVFWGFVVFWGFGKLQIFGILTLYFGDLGNCKSLVF